MLQDHGQSEPDASRRLVADLGNSRLKWGLLTAEGAVGERVSLPLDDLAAWDLTYRDWGLEPDDAWTISTVNPPCAEVLRSFLIDRGAKSLRWLRSMSDVPTHHTLREPTKTGADRALAVLAALDIAPPQTSGLVISCGTAITVEHVTAGGVWQGGAIAPGMGLSARALNRLTAQLPLVGVDGLPPAWGDSTEPAMAAGIFWGTVGAVRELIARQDGAQGWRIWTGGDAETIAPHVDGPSAWIVSDLVLIGLARLAGP